MTPPNHAGSTNTHRPEIKPYPVLTNASMACDQTSLATVVQKVPMVGYTFFWSGNRPSGLLGIQVSNDFSINQDGRVVNPGNWSNYSFLHDGLYMKSISIFGDSGTAHIELPQISFYATRAIYTFKAGTGTLNAFVNGKVG